MERCQACLTNSRNNPRALIALKLFSLGSGIFLLVAGLLGCISLFTQPFLIVVSAYAIIFGFMVIVIEHGTWLDNMPLLDSFYQLLDAEFHMVASQRGKGFFYTGVGVLTLFIRDESAFSLSTIGVASICLIIAGVLHSFRIVHEEAMASGSKQEGGAQLSGGAEAGAAGGGGQPAFPPPNAGAVPPVEHPPPPPAEAGTTGHEWNSMVASVHEREGGEGQV